VFIPTSYTQSVEQVSFGLAVALTSHKITATSLQVSPKATLPTLTMNDK